MSDFVEKPIKKKLNRNNPASRIERVERRTGPQPSATIRALDELSPDMGDQIAGRFIAPSDESSEPTDSAFSGTFLAAEEQELPDGTQDAWLAKINAGEVEFSVGVDGIYQNRLVGGYEQNATDLDTSTTRNLKMGMFSLDGKSVGSGGFIYGGFTEELTYPDFSDGAFADWTAVSGSNWTVATDDKGKTYATFAGSDTGEKRINRNKATSLFLDFDMYEVSGNAYVKVVFYTGSNGSGTIVRTQTFNAGTTRKREQHIIIGPNSAASFRVFIGCTSGVPVFYRVSVQSATALVGDSPGNYLLFHPNKAALLSSIGDGTAAAGRVPVTEMRVPRVDEDKDKLTATPGAAGNVDVGVHGVITTFVDNYGETDADLSKATSVTVSTSAKTVALTAIPLGKWGTTQRKIYATIAGATQTDPTQYYLVATINDNTTTTETYNISDATLVTGAQLPTVNTTGSRPAFPKRWAIFGDDIITSVTMANNIAAGSTHNFGLYVGPTAANANDGDLYTADVWLEAGAYTLYHYSITTADSGKLDYYLDNVLVESGVDWYSAAGTFNVTKSFSLTVPTSGYHILEMKVNGKNASATDYRVFFTKITFRPTAY